MNPSSFQPASLRIPSLLGGTPAPNAHMSTGGRIRLGSPGQCPKAPTLTITISDDSGSLYGPAGNDPLSNRYAEAMQAIRAVAKRCTCGDCQAAVIHFDTPTSGCVEPTPFTRAGLRQLQSGLAVPVDAAGTSLLGPSLGKAEALAAASPDHQSVLVILTDWQLFDDDLPDLLTRLARFQGLVYAVALRNEPPHGLLDPAIHVVTVKATSPPGSLARAIFAGLTTHRPGRSIAHDAPS